MYVFTFPINSDTTDTALTVKYDYRIVKGDSQSILHHLALNICKILYNTVLLTFNLSLFT